VKQEDRREFVEVVLGFAELKGKQLSKPAVDLYWQAMQHWSIGEFKAAAQHLLGTCAFFPTPKEFEDLRRAGRPTAGEAWAKVVAAARRGGGTDDPLLERAVAAMGGWLVIRMSDEDKLHFLERRFAEHYAEIQDATDTREAVPMLPRSSTGPRRLGATDFASLTGPRRSS
jgi:hypothetical protein